MPTDGLKVKCPTCKIEIVWAEVPTRPFCSDRCRLIDLGEWASEKYSVPDEHSQPDSKGAEKNEDQEDDSDS